MSFHIGDKVIHCTFGLGDITQIEEKPLTVTRRTAMWFI